MWPMARAEFNQQPDHVPSVSYREKQVCAYCAYLKCCESLLSLYGSGAGCSLPIRLRVVGLNLPDARRSVQVTRGRRETIAESWSVRSSSMNCVRGLSTKNSSKNSG